MALFLLPTKGLSYTTQVVFFIGVDVILYRNQREKTIASKVDQDQGRQKKGCLHGKGGVSRLDWRTCSIYTHLESVPIVHSSNSTINLHSRAPWPSPDSHIDWDGNYKVVVKSVAHHQVKLTNQCHSGTVACISPLGTK